MSVKEYPSIKHIRQCFRYEDGKLYWLERPREHFKTEGTWKAWNMINSGKEAGSFNKARDGYRCKIGINGNIFYRHKIVFALIHGYYPKIVDHENRDRLDDHIENLRAATKSQDGANRKIRCNKKSPYKGVYFYKPSGRWVAQIRVNGKGMHLGYFDDPKEAQIAYMKAAREHFGEFASEG